MRKVEKAAVLIVGGVFTFVFGVIAARGLGDEVMILVFAVVVGLTVSIPTSLLLASIIDRSRHEEGNMESGEDDRPFRSPPPSDPPARPRPVVPPPSSLLSEPVRDRAMPLGSYRMIDAKRERGGSDD